MVMQRPVCAPCPVLPSRRGWPLHEAVASRAIEQAAAAGLPAHTLMARAGEATARLALAIAPHARSIDLCCGPGNNGGDGLIAATHLYSAERSVRIILLGDAARLPPDALDALQRARQAGVRIDSALPDSLQADLIVDALLGLGANRIVDGPLAQAVQRINAANRPVLAVDLPSGLHGDSGAVLGEHAVCATHTLSLLTLKPGLFTGHGRTHAGRVWFDDLAVESSSSTACAVLIGPEDVRGTLPARSHAQHKGSFGNAIVIGGAPGMAGAALLAARAALVAGAGRVFAATLGLNDAALDPVRPELMLRSLASVLEPRVLSDATVVCGCGAGDSVREPLPPILHHAARLVLDADALNTIALEPGLRQALRERARRGLPTIVTPHPLEAARLLACDVQRVQVDRLRAAKELARELAATVVLKGSGTVLAAADAMPRVNPTGNARLATAGTGDVLAGWLGGLWAQQPAATTAIDVASCAAWVHGRAAEPDGGRGPLLAARLIEAMAHATESLRDGRS